MDPVSLSTMGLSVVAAVTRVLLEKAEQVERLRKRESKFARQYKKSINDLAVAAAEIQACMYFTVQQGNTRAIARLLSNEEGSAALKKLVTMLDTTRGFLTAQDAAANKMISILTRKKRNILTDALGVDDEEATFEVVMKDATTSLETYRADLKRQYDQFNSLYTVFLTVFTPIHSRVQLPPGHDAGESHEHRIRNYRSDLQKEFNRCPFHLNLTNSDVIGLARDLDDSEDKTSSSRLDAILSTMRNLGRQWVKKHFPSTSESSILTLAETTVLEKLLTSIDLDLAVQDLEATSGGNEGVADDSHRLRLALMQSTMLRKIRYIRTRRYSIAFVGTIKAGKSLFLSELMGYNPFPSDETSCPCRLSHIKGQQEPSLTIDLGYFQDCIESLRKKGFGTMMKGYEPPMNDCTFSALLDTPDDLLISEDTTSSPFEDSIEKWEIFKIWNELRTRTKERLLQLEEPDFILPKEATGRGGVMKLLGLVNDIIQLCHHFGIEKSQLTPESWPLLKLEFESLRDFDIDSKFEFIDLPGIGKTGSGFDEVIREIVKGANAVVPVISFKEIQQENWRQKLPEIVRTGLQHPPELVLCTHFEHANHSVHELVGRVAKTFWPNTPVDESYNKILLVATRMGASSRLLLKMSEYQKPDFKEIWEGNSILHDCSLKVLGDWQSERTYSGLTADAWKQALTDQLGESGLSKCILRLLDELVKPRPQVLANENSIMRKQLREAVVNEHRFFLGLRRSREDHVKAYNEFLQVSEKYRAILEEWEAERTGENSSSLDILSTEFLNSRIKTINKVNELAEVKKREFRDNGKLHEVHIDTPKVDERIQLVFSHSSDADTFLREIQTGVVDILNNGKKELTEFIRTLASKAHAAFFKSLRERIKKHMSDDELHAALKGDIVAELSEEEANVENLTFVNIRQKLVHTIAKRHSRVSAYRAIQNAVARPFLNKRSGDAFLNAPPIAIDEPEDWDKSTKGSGDGNKSSRGVEDLSFMLRAPIKVVASLSWLLGSGVWPFMKQSEKIVMDEQDFLGHLREDFVADILKNIQKESEITLTAMMDSSWIAAKSVIEVELEKEENYYRKERLLKSKPVSEEKVAASFATLLNFVAAESAILKLQA
ncbi:hypothetical protein SCHPADRAFT_938044 [Schizopora paradoxa]|uniref:Uncharacterized protein n=1 Tax=Schizopora paradoxa TaxID=27342 RepID=A0A0H2SGQ2_9AGAM|nr:hypothetical protein SCHPADRAFT_938044 [Schizopora paradoxa]